MCCCSVAQSYPTLCNLMDCSTPASLSFPISWSLLKLMSIELVMPSNHLILCHPFIFCLQSFPASGSFPMSWLFASGRQSIGASASALALSVNIQGWFPLRLTGLITLLSKGLLRVFSSTTIWEHKFFGIQPSYGPILTFIHDYWKTHSFVCIALSLAKCLSYPFFQGESIF